MGPSQRVKKNHAGRCAAAADTEWPAAAVVATAERCGVRCREHRIHRQASWRCRIQCEPISASVGAVVVAFRATFERYRDLVWLLSTPAKPKFEV